MEGVGKGLSVFGFGILRRSTSPIHGVVSGLIGGALLKDKVVNNHVDRFRVLNDSRAACAAV